jgi:hypothetical protein
LFAFLSVSVACAEEGGKAPAPRPKRQAAKAQVAPSPVPRQFVGTPTAKRLMEIQAQIDAAAAKVGPAHQEAENARRLAFQAEQKYENLRHTVAELEKERFRTINQAEAQAREAAVQKAAWEKSQREAKRWGEMTQIISKLEAQVQSLTAQLEPKKAQKPQAPVAHRRHERQGAAAGSVRAAEQKAPPCPAARWVGFLTQGLTLTGEQKAKLDVVCKEFGPKMMDAMKKRDVRTPEQKKAEANAMKAAQAAGKKGKEWFQAVAAAVKLTDAQKAQQVEAQKNMHALEKDLREKVTATLTADQREQLKKKFEPQQRKPAK